MKDIILLNACLPLDLKYILFLLPRTIFYLRSSTEGTQVAGCLKDGKGVAVSVDGFNL